jgi:hypothetical protein
MVQRTNLWVAGLVLALGCAGPAPPPPERAGLPAPVSVGPSPLRRLTRAEYDRAVRDLLGDPTAPASRFAPDEESAGYASNARAPVTELLVQQYADAAEQIAARAAGELQRLLPCAVMGGDACARSFITSFAPRAYRRPLSTAEEQRLFALYAGQKERHGFADGVRLVIAAVLQSPSFLYHVEIGEPGQPLRPLSPHEVAARLSFLLRGTLPDGPLREAAAAGTLRTVEQIAAQARRLLAEGEGPVPEFLAQWLRLPALADARRDPARFPDWDEGLRRALAASAQAFLSGVLDARQGDGRLRTLLLAPVTFADPELRPRYGQDAEPRIGVLSLPAALTLLSPGDEPSPVRRGRFVRERLLCQAMPPPPADVDTTPPEGMAGQGARERYQQLTANPTCAGCHRLMDPIGFGFERYDALGRYRGRAIDAGGEVLGSRDADGAFSGVPELARRLAGSAQVGECLATQWFRFALGRIETPDDRAALAALEARFLESGGDLRLLPLLVTETPQFRYLPAEPSE